ncbi:hypothetical protein HOV23_gp095 [Pseudomonas phage Lana]|uniref:Uncharacterized protein n=1 Tax=Pseudomonas phage Lana TaxID=2530172 RepID=A0A481W759_9CAUD|nr:hypothetical protein HOV23_gp095 [Pseudomonas phage Lana]QBJ04478.1 hypothetical protein [Pseudomonas phage Lana]
MTTKVKQDEFHSMRGHIADGVEIQMNNGDTLTLKAVMQGWQLFHGDRQWAPPTNSAYVIECLVFSYPNPEIGP